VTTDFDVLHRALAAIPGRVYQFHHISDPHWGGAELNDDQAPPVLAAEVCSQLLHGQSLTVGLRSTQPLCERAVMQRH
jgi:hypothetical protein